MNRYIIGSLWDRVNRNGANKNFEYLFEGSKRVDELNKRADSILDNSNSTLNEAKKTNDMNKNVQQQINTLIAESGTSDAEVLQARVGRDNQTFDVLKSRLDFIDRRMKDTEEVINVKNYGVVGDGVTDDTVALQNLLDQHNKIHFPEGDYKTSGLIIKHKTFLTGDGRDSTRVFLSEDSSKSLFKNIGYIGGFEALDITFDDNGVKNNRVSRVDSIFQFENVYPITFKRCDFINVVYGINMEVTAPHSGINKTHKIIFSECNFSSDPEGFGTHADVAMINVNRAMNDGLIDNCNFEKISGNAVRVYPFGETPNQIPPKRWTIINNKIDDVQRYEPGTQSGDLHTGAGVYYRGDDLYMSDNKIFNVKRNPLDIQGINDQQTTAKNINVSNNIFKNDTGYSGYAHSSMCLFRNVELNFFNNIVFCDDQASGSHGLEHKWGGSLIMEGNKILNSWRDSVSIWASDESILPGNVEDVIIKGNILRTSGSSSTFSAISISLATNKNYRAFAIGDNIVRGHVVRTIKLNEGTGRILRLSGSGNVSTEGKNFFMNDTDVDNIWQLDVSSQNERLKSTPTAIGTMLLDGVISLRGEGIMIKPLTELPAANSTRSGNIIVLDESGIHNLYVCLRNGSAYVWHKISSI